jgi:hypothetical protein
MRKPLLFIILFFTAVLPYSAICNTIHVPADFSTIQEGINASANGDTVLVEPGTYFENLNLNGKDITLCSKYFTTGNTAFISSTIIDGSNADRVITINQGEDSSCQIIGFTIQHGNSPSIPGVTYGGGGIFIVDTSPQIHNCIIQNNYAPGYGGGLCLYGNSSAKVLNCTIQNNTADSFGGGVFMGDCSTDAEITNCIISGNTITCNCDFNGGGGGVNLYHTGKLVNCLIVNNSAPNASIGGGGVHCDWGDEATHSILVIGCTIANNTALNNGGVSYVIVGGEFRNCIIWGNIDQFGGISNYDGNTYVNCCTDPLPAGAGNISSDPMFVNPTSTNFRLSTGSPCIDTGDNSYNSQPLDLDGNPRISNINIDMGAYEQNIATTVNVQIGSGSDLSELFPINAWYGYSYSQQIYLGSEIISGGGGAGSINKIRFFYSGGGSGFSQWNNWTVYLGNTAKTGFASSDDWVPVVSMTQVFSGIIPDPVAGNWVEITLTTPFSYSGGNIVVAVDENSDNYDNAVQWLSFNTGSPRGLVVYDDINNPDPASPTAANDGPSNSIAQVQFEITGGYGTLEGYITEQPACTAPIQGATVTTGTYSVTTNALGFYHLTLPIGSYFDVTAHHGDVSQTISPVYIMPGNTTTQDFCLQPYFAPPVNLQASLSGPVLNNVHLSWMAPGSVADQYIHWDNGSIYGGLGFGAPMTFNVASRWPVADIAPYGGTYLKKIRFVPADANAAYTLKVWKGTDASTLLLSQVVTDPIIGGWNEVALTTPILIDGTEELWFGYEIIQTVDGYPAGLGSGPAVVRKGDMINAGYGWFSVKEAWGWEFNWTLQGFVSESPVPLASQQLMPMVQSTSPETGLTNPLPSSVKPHFFLCDPTESAKPPSNQIKSNVALPMPVNQPPVLSSAVFTGYNVYRDNVKIGNNIPELFYDDLLRPKGGYNYEVSAQYDLGESARIGVHVDIYTCFPPTGLTVSNATLSTTTANLAWTPSTISTNLEWILEWGPAGFTQGSGTTIHVAPTPGYSLSNLTPGTEYDFYVRTYCSSTDSSAWVKKTFRTHYFDCPLGATAEPEACGAATNNGCEMAIPQVGSISCGETVCGTAWLHRSHRDSDWYSFTLLEANDVTLTGNAEFTNFMGVVSAPCPTAIFYNSTTNSPGYNTPIVLRLNGPGVYFVNVAPAFAEQVACDSLNHYWIKLACNSCLSPTALNAINITTTSADLGWTSGATKWNIEWGPYGFSQGSGTMITGTTTNPHHLSGLTMGYAYSYYVQSDCGSGAKSNWAGPYTFTLPCPAKSLPYAEDFSSQTVGITPQCWQVTSPGAPTNWTTEFSNTAGGTSPELNFHGWNPWFSGRSFLTSPVINTTGMAELDISLKQYIYSYSAATHCEIWTTSNGGNTWISAWSLSQAGTFGPQTSNFAISSADVGSATFQFAFAVNGNSWDIGNWQIDDISLTGVPQLGTLEGIVNDCSTLNLLQGVTVSAGANTTTTNASGFYQFLNIPVATYDIGFSMSGYLTKTVPGVQVLNGATTTQDICLGPPSNTTVQNITVSNGFPKCFDATQTIIVAGSGTTFIVENGGIANMIAGKKISYLTGTWAKNGSKMHGKIAPSGPYCLSKAPSLVTADAGELENSMVVEKPGLKVYPNPTSGKFRLELTGIVQTEMIRVEIYGMRGERVSAESVSAEPVHEFSLSDKPAGIYFVKVVAGETIVTTKVIKTR